MTMGQLRATPYRMQKVLIAFKRHAATVRTSGKSDEWKSKELTGLAGVASTEFKNLQHSFEAGALAMYDTVLGPATEAAQKTVVDMFADGASVSDIAEYAAAVGDKTILAALKAKIPEKAFAGRLMPANEPERAKNRALELLFEIARNHFPEIASPLQELEISRNYVRLNVEGWEDYFNRSTAFLDDSMMHHLVEPPLYGWLGLPGGTAEAYLPTDKEVDEPTDDAVYQPPAPIKDAQDLGVTQWGKKGESRRMEPQREPRSGDVVGGVAYF